MKGYKYSIIIPHINEWYYLDIMLDSFYNYIKYDNYEIIIVDDGSKNLTDLSFIKKHFLKDKIKLYKNKPKGLPFSKNYWAEKSSGDILIFFDSHMYIKTDILEQINDIYVNNLHISFLQLSIWNIRDKAQKWEVYKIKDMTLNSTWDISKEDKDIVETTNLAWAWTIVRREDFEKLLGFNRYFKKWWAEDLEFSMRATLFWYKLYLVKSIIVQHYFKEKFLNTVVKSEDILYNKIIFTLTCFKNQKRIDQVFQKLQSEYWEKVFLEQYKLIQMDIDLNNYIKDLHNNFKRDDDWYFKKFNEYYKTFDDK